MKSIKILIVFAVVPFFLIEVLLMKNIITFPNTIDFGFFGIRTYGLLITSGVILVTLLLKREIVKIKDLKRLNLIDGLIVALSGGLIGARIYHLITDWQIYKDNPISALYLWNGGLGIYGAIFGGLLALYLYSKKRGFRFQVAIDLIAVYMPLTQIVGRAGNLINHEIVGLPTNLPWSWDIAEVSSATDSFHPVFLYEQLGNVILFISLFLLYKKGYKNLGKLGNGFLSLIYLIGYSIVRFVVEFWRIEPKVVFDVLSINQVVCIFVIIVSAAMFVYRYKLIGGQK